MQHLPTTTTTAALAALLWLALLSPTSHAQVYRCGSSYSSQPCPGGSTIALEAATGASATTADTDLTKTRQRKHARSQEERDARAWERTERELDKAQANTPPQRQAGKNRAECEATSRRIQKIDELARKGGSAQKMEKLREERQSARDRQFSAGC